MKQSEWYSENCEGGWRKYFQVSKVIKAKTQQKSQIDTLHKSPSKVPLNGHFSVEKADQAAKGAEASLSLKAPTCYFNPSLYCIKFLPR